MYVVKMEEGSGRRCDQCLTSFTFKLPIQLDRSVYRAPNEVIWLNCDADDISLPAA